MSDARFKSVVMHRRCGKSVYCVLKLMSEASKAGGGFQGHYIGPSIKQTRSIAFKYMVEIAKQIGGVEINKSELAAKFPSGATVELNGVENIDALRGLYSNFLVVDEAQLMPQSYWAYVMRPLLADRQGKAIVSGTPSGESNLLHWAHTQPTWDHFMFKWDETDSLTADEVEQIRREISPEAFDQEFNCDFSVPLQGAFLSRQMRDMEKEGRITTVGYDPILPVYKALDLGMADALAEWTFQKAGNQVHCIKYREYHYTALPELVKIWKEEPWPIDHVLLPFDARVRELGTGKSRLEVLRSLGVNCSVVKKMSVYDGIEAMRVSLPKFWMDKTECKLGIDALKAYRAEYDETKGRHKITPLHDFASHGADAMRYLCTGLESVGSLNWAPLDYSEMDRTVSW